MEKMSKTITDEQIRAAYKELQAEGKVKVEFATAADKILTELKLIENDLDSQERKIDKPYDALRSVLIDWWQLLDDSKADIKDQESKLKTFVSQVKELGIPTKDVKIIDVIEKKIKDLRFVIKNSEKVNWNIK